MLLANVWMYLSLRKESSYNGEFKRMQRKDGGVGFSLQSSRQKQRAGNEKDHDPYNFITDVAERAFASPDNQSLTWRELQAKLVSLEVSSAWDHSLNLLSEHITQSFFERWAAVHLEETIPEVDSMRQHRFRQAARRGVITQLAHQDAAGALETVIKEISTGRAAHFAIDLVSRFDAKLALDLAIKYKEQVKDDLVRTAIDACIVFDHEAVLACIDDLNIPQYRTSALAVLVLHDRELALNLAHRFDVYCAVLGYYAVDDFEAAIKALIAHINDLADSEKIAAVNDFVDSHRPHPKEFRSDLDLDQAYRLVSRLPTCKGRDGLCSWLSGISHSLVEGLRFYELVVDPIHKTEIGVQLLDSWGTEGLPSEMLPLKSIYEAERDVTTQTDMRG